MRMTPKMYYDVMNTVLSTIIDVIIANEDKIHVDKSSLLGRKGSIYFEDDFLKPLIREYDHLYHKEVNKALSNNGYSRAVEFVKVYADENNDEASMRTMEDIAVGLIFDGSYHKERINVKATVGDTADNVGGWSALSYATWGEIGLFAKTKTKFKEAATTIPLTDSLHDYFLWVFYKGEDDGRDILLSQSLHSFLGTSLDAFTINLSQSFPVQFSSKKAVSKDFVDHTIVEAKRDFIMMVFNKIEEYRRKEADDAAKVLNVIRGV